MMKAARRVTLGLAMVLSIAAPAVEPVQAVAAPSARHHVVGGKVANGAPQPRLEFRKAHPDERA